MTDSETIREGSEHEVVGLFAEQGPFEAAINALKEAGFERADLSLLSSHESIDAAGSPAEPWSDVLTAAVGELKYEAPMVASGAIFLVGGPVAATVAGLIGAATGVVAVREVLEGVISTPHTEEFQRALEAGSVILWVRAADAAKEKSAMQILEDNGATNVHIHQGAA